MKPTKTISAIATVRGRQRPPAVIMATQSRQARRASCRANQAIVPGVLTPL